MGRALLNLFEFLKTYKTFRCKSSKDLATGDVVACFGDKKKLQCLGKVVHIGRTDLMHDHEDGPFGDVFVLPYYKGRVKKGTPLNEQTGWWMFNELTVLPKRNEQFSAGDYSKNVLYVGHKPTTRREQIQQNWTIEIVDYDAAADSENSKASTAKSAKSKVAAAKSAKSKVAAAESAKSKVAAAESAKSKVAAAKSANSKAAATDSNSKADNDTPQGSPRRSPRRISKPKFYYAASKARAVGTSKSRSSKVSKKQSEEEADPDLTPDEDSAKTKSKKKLTFVQDEFETPDVIPKKKMRKRKNTKFERDVIFLALAGDCNPLQDYIANFDMARAVTSSKAQVDWEAVLPAWTTKEKSRGLKGWRSKTARGEWNVSGVCAKVINKSVSIYMDIFAFPPVYEGVRTGTSSLSVKEGGLDLYKPFLLTVHRAYCRNLNPEVEVGMVAFDKVLQYMNTHPVRLKLLRAVR